MWGILESTFTLVLCAQYWKKPRNHTATFYRPQRSCEGYVFTPVCDSVNRGGVPDQVHPPWNQVPPGPGTPPCDQVLPPGPGTHPGHKVPPVTRYSPLWPGTPPRTRYTPPWPGTLPWPGTPPPEQSKMEDTVNVRTVRILLECILVIFRMSPPSVSVMLVAVVHRIIWSGVSVFKYI